MGIGWHLRSVGPLRVAAHGGTLGGHVLLLEIAPERNFAIGILTNANNGWRLIQDVERAALKIYQDATFAPNQAIAHRGLVETLPSAEPLATQPDAAPYLGRYVRPMNAVEVRSEGGRLLIQTIPTRGTPQAAMPIAFYGPDRAVVTDGTDRGQSVEFVRDTAGTVNWIRVTEAGARRLIAETERVRSESRFHGSGSRFGRFEGPLVERFRTPETPDSLELHWNPEPEQTQNQEPEPRNLDRRGTCLPISVMPSVPCGAGLRSRQPRSSRWRSASARRRPCRRSRTAFWCGPFRIRTPIGWFACGRSIRAARRFWGIAGSATARTTPGWSSRARLTCSAGSACTNGTIRVQNDDVRVFGSEVSPALIAALGARPRLGRLFAAGDADDGTGRVVLISEALWRERLSADPDTIGRVLPIDGESHVIVGVVADPFHFPDAGISVWLPYRVPALSSDPALSQRTSGLSAIARIAPGATPAQVEAEGTVDGAQRAGDAVHAAAVRPGRPAHRPDAAARGGRDRRREARAARAPRGGRVRAADCLRQRREPRAGARPRAAAGARRARGHRRGTRTARTPAARRVRSPVARRRTARRRPRVAAGPADPRVRAGAVPPSRRAAARRLDAGVRGRRVARRADRRRTACRRGAARGSTWRNRCAAATAPSAGGVRTARARRLRDGLLVAESAFAVLLLVGASLLARSFVALINVDPGYTADRVLTARVLMPPTSPPERAAAFIDALARAAARAARRRRRRRGQHDADCRPDSGFNPRAARERPGGGCHEHAIGVVRHHAGIRGSARAAAHEGPSFRAVGHHLRRARVPRQRGVRPAVPGRDRPPGRDVSGEPVRGRTGAADVDRRRRPEHVEERQRSAPPAGGVFPARRPRPAHPGLRQPRDSHEAAIPPR